MGPRRWPTPRTSWGLDVDDLLPLVDALELLGFAEVEAGQLRLTEAGLTFAGADIQASKRIFAEAVSSGHRSCARSSTGSTAPRMKRCEPGSSARCCDVRSARRKLARQLDVAIDWGRYAEQYAFDADHDEFVADPDRISVLGDRAHELHVSHRRWRSRAWHRGLLATARSARDYSGWLAVGLRKLTSSICSSRPG